MRVFSGLESNLPDLRSTYHIDSTLNIDPLHGVGCGWKSMTETTDFTKGSSCGTINDATGLTTFTPSWTFTDWSRLEDSVPLEQEWECGCDPYYLGQKCEIYECEGALSNETLCSGHGSCLVGGGKCSCVKDYYGAKCDVFPCGDGLSNQTLRNGHGSCTTFGGDCACNQFYYGQFCDVYECAGVLLNETVCNDHGRCSIAGGDRCFCSDYYHGVTCQDGDGM